jgi:hypothetical protein
MCFIFGYPQPGGTLTRWNPIRKLMLDFLHPSGMTPEERMDKLARIVATGFLRVTGFMSLPKEDGARISLPSVSV